MASIDEIIASGQSPSGTFLISPEDLEVSLPYIRQAGLYVSSMESYIIEGDKEITTFDFCLLGLDEREDVNNGYNSNISFDIVLELIKSAKEANKKIMFQVWLDDISNLDGVIG